MKKFILFMVLLLSPSLVFATTGQIRSVVMMAKTATGGAAFTDDFNRANETPIASPWAVSSGFNVLKILNNAVEPSVDGNGAAYYNSTFANNQYSQILAPQDYTTVQHGPVVRVSPSAQTGYAFIRNGASSVTFGKWVNGSWGGTFGSCSTPSFTGGAIMRLEVSGTSLVGKVGGTTICTATDSDIASGYPGVWFYGLNFAVDDWAGGDL